MVEVEKEGDSLWQRHLDEPFGYGATHGSAPSDPGSLLDHLRICLPYGTLSRNHRSAEESNPYFQSNASEEVRG